MSDNHARSSKVARLDEKNSHDNPTKFLYGIQLHLILFFFWSEDGNVYNVSLVELHDTKFIYYKLKQANDNTKNANN